MTTSDLTSHIPNDRLMFTVRVKALIGEDRLEEEDQDVPGDYDISLPAEARDWTRSRQACVVLDKFHDSVAIGMLEDFEISVLNAQGEEIFEDDDTPSHPAR